MNSYLLLCLSILLVIIGVKMICDDIKDGFKLSKEANYVPTIKAIFGIFFGLLLLIAYSGETVHPIPG